MAADEQPAAPQPPQQPTSRSRGESRWLTGFLGGPDIERRVDENFPSWQEYSQHKTREAREEKVPLPPHRIYISSPLQGNLVYILLVGLAVALAIYRPELGPVLIYGAIALVVMTSVFVIFRDGLFLHMEALRLEQDAGMINRHSKGPQSEFDEQPMGFMRPFSRKHRHSKIFRSRLLQIHYQNVLRTFEQGNRRTWVDQDASIADLHTLLSQRGMKLVWTMIEVLPQLGLLGTLIGLMRMFMAFRADVTSPEVEILAGFGTALGTTVVANLLVLILRPLYMRNERSMSEVLSTIQTLMATFILPTQETVLERTLLAGMGKWGQSQTPPQPMQPTASATSPGPAQADNRLFQSLSELTHALGSFTETQKELDSGAMAKQTTEIAEEVRDTLHAFQNSLEPSRIESQERAFREMTGAVQALAGNLERLNQAAAREHETANERIEHDLTQLRVLTHDTLLLLEEIAGRLGFSGGGRGGKLLSGERKLKSQVFTRESPETGAPSEGEPESGEEGGPVRLFRGPA